METDYTNYQVGSRIVGRRKVKIVKCPKCGRNGCLRVYQGATKTEHAIHHRSLKVFYGTLVKESCFFKEGEYVS